MSLSASSLLSAWERGLEQPPAERALGLLCAAHPESREELAKLPVGERDARLLAVREALFGPRLESVVACPACGETLEFAVDVAEVTAPRKDPQPEPLEVEEGGTRVRFRLPDGRDLRALEGCDPRQGRRLLLERCVIDARRGASTVASGELPAELVAAVAEAMERADPQANVALALTCPECGHRWQSPFDAASYLWTETEAWARRTLAAVHALASVYGWSESEVLALGARRRQVYLDMIGR